MTKEDIIRMAHEAGWRALPNSAFAFTSFSLERVAARVAAAAREACNKAADDQWVRNPNVSGGDAIRARGEASIRSNT